MFRVCHLNTCPVGVATQKRGTASEIPRQTGKMSSPSSMAWRRKSGKSWRNWDSAKWTT
ncbi:MAG: hypothetical protein LR011_09255 [Verrucomicrobia bacterium]|nr:hypothetical protein [Verrucomicrobiota bacterium]